MFHGTQTPMPKWGVIRQVVMSVEAWEITPQIKPYTAGHAFSAVMEGKDCLQKSVFVFASSERDSIFTQCVPLYLKERGFLFDCLGIGWHPLIPYYLPDRSPLHIATDVLLIQPLPRVRIRSYLSFRKSHPLGVHLPITSKDRSYCFQEGGGAYTCESCIIMPTIQLQKPQFGFGRDREWNLLSWGGFLTPSIR